MKSSTLSRTGHELGAQGQSGTIPHFTEQKSIAPTMTARGTRSFITGPSGST